MSYNSLNSRGDEPKRALESLTISVSDLGRHAGGWWFQIDVHGEGDAPEEIEVAIYLQSKRLEVGTLDGWGDWTLILRELKLKAGEEVIFEVKSKSPRLMARSPLVEAGGVIATLERERRWIKSESLHGANLSGAHLSDACLDGVDLREANLSNVKLARASLRDALLCNAQLKNADLYEAHFEGADLEGANLEGADVEGARFERADLRGVRGLSLDILEIFMETARLDAEQKQQVYETRAQRMKLAEEEAKTRKKQAETKRKMDAAEETKRKIELKRKAEEKARRLSEVEQKRATERAQLRAEEERRQTEERQYREKIIAQRLKQEEENKRQQEARELENLQRELKLKEQMIQQRRRSWVEAEQEIIEQLREWGEQTKEWRHQEEARYRDHLAQWEDERQTWETQNKKLIQRIRLGIEIPSPPIRPIYEEPFEIPPLIPTVTRNIQGVSFELLILPSMNFVVGRGTGAGVRPQQAVRLSHKFWVAQTPVTQELWRVVTGDKPSWFQGDRRPVENVSWWNAISFCNQLSLLDGLKPVYQIEGERKVEWNRDASGYRLLTDAEWEGAARSGFDLKFPGSKHLDEVGWFLSNSHRKTHTVAQRKPNFWGLYDLSGNVREWVFDDFSMTLWPPEDSMGDFADSMDLYYAQCSSEIKISNTADYGGYSSDFTQPNSSQELVNPVKVDLSKGMVNPVHLDLMHTFKVVRGGGWDQGDDVCQVTSRESVRPTHIKHNLGFRIARNWGAE